MRESRWGAAQHSRLLPQIVSAVLLSGSTHPSPSSSRVQTQLLPQPVKGPMFSGAGDCPAQPVGARPQGTGDVLSLVTRTEGTRSVALRAFEILLLQRGQRMEGSFCGFEGGKK